jgi:transposase
MNGETVLAYIEQCLVPTLNRGDIVVMDNLTAHLVAGIKEAIEAAGDELRYLPQYCAARLAAIPAGESPANRGVQSLL